MQTFRDSSATHCSSHHEAGHPIARHYGHCRQHATGAVRPVRTCQQAEGVLLCQTHTAHRPPVLAAPWHRPGVCRAASSEMFDGDSATSRAEPDAWQAPVYAKRKSFWQNAQEILTLALPLGMTNISGYTLNTLSDAMIGRLGHTALSTSTLANSFYGMMGVSIIWGGAAGMETLAGQAYGAGNLRLMRLVLMRAMTVCWGLCVPIALLWQHAEWLLVMLGQCPAISVQCAGYLKALVPSLFAYVLAECLQSYFVCQNNVQPATWAKGLTALVGPGLYYVLMFKMNLGLSGAAYAYALCKLLNAGLLIGYAAWQHRSEHTDSPQPSAAATASSSATLDSTSVTQTSTSITQTSSSITDTIAATTSSTEPTPTQTVPTHDRIAQQQSEPASPSEASVSGASTALPAITLAEVLDPGGVGAYIKFGLPSALMTMLEWWAYEVNVILAGTLPDAEVAVAVLGICLAISGWFYMFPQSISTATCTRISNALGAGDARSARDYFRTAIRMVLLQQVVLAGVILTFAPQLVDFFCPGDASLMTVAMGIVPIVAVNTLADGMNVVLNGVLRACGRQALGARLQLCSYWVVGVPLSWCLGVRMHMGIAGFLMAIGFTSFVQATVCGFILSRFNWRTEVSRSQDLLNNLVITSAEAEQAAADKAA